MNSAHEKSNLFAGIVPALADVPRFSLGQRVRVLERSPVGHYRVPIYLRGKPAIIEAEMAPKAVHNEEEAFGRNAGSLGFYYRISVRMTSIWSSYRVSATDSLHIEVFESWLEGIQ